MAAAARARLAAPSSNRASRGFEPGDGLLSEPGSLAAREDLRRAVDRESEIGPTERTIDVGQDLPVTHGGHRAALAVAKRDEALDFLDPARGECALGAELDAGEELGSRPADAEELRAESGPAKTVLAL